MRIDRIETDSISAGVMKPFEQAAAALGSEGFYRAFSQGLEDAVKVDRLFLIEGSARAQPLIAETEADKLAVSGASYVAHFLPRDPLQTAIDRIDGEGAVLRLKVEPDDIVVPAYKAMMQRAGVVERVSFLRKFGGTGWRCLTVVRRRQSGPFEDRELDWLGCYYRLLMPLIDRHRALVGEVVEGRAQRIEELEQRFAARFPALTPREREVCARAAIGVSVEGAALDLAIATSSVLTYRKRAYQRLGISSAYELACLVLR
ncbi:MAG TPA: helix-turn-helix transcriptional regulator [Rhizobiaceae bacterium]|nr:helix-turn-helix transcriptional regulator [Rhizobiaceae bacterium]